ncbi:hypothetical protein D9756_001287 [Leucocoprinus leucothites]|uniref:Hydrophobin n=1 Tax=Leucocoprinus leucothites TaxID=201217 RepID=A0A8H5G3Z7_9AGAR|nr:hypothetical protein D9756_001287 [Leucoagaricus leucothites]
MFSRIFIAALVALPMIVSATPTPSHHDGGDCNVGELHCCEHTSNMGPTGASAGGLLGIPLNLLPQIGMNCDPISVLGVGGNNCAAQPVCCQQTAFSGLLNLFNCSPINLNL